MRSPTTTSLSITIVITVLPVLLTGQSIDYARDIQPILSDNCYQCHGPDRKARKAKLRLDVRDVAVAERDGLHPILPGKPDESEVMARVLHDDPEEAMPPSKTGKKLNSREVELLRRWIAQGAKFSRHWAFIPPVRPPTAKTRMTNWVRSPLDSFVLAKLEREGLKPSAEADRATWLRRVSFDLTGLPPTVGELDEFLKDQSTKAYQKASDRLLRSSRYGEHMARHWLDAARYADTNGYQYDRNRDQWVWRDWVIHAFNTNKSFDRFTIEQIAGDLLPDATDQTRLATGFHRNHPITIEGGVIDEEYRTEYVVDRVVTTSTVWMGLTMTCSRCHDHKYDPISQEDFYSFFAFFNQIPERGLNGFNPKITVPSPLAAGKDGGLAKRRSLAEKTYRELLGKSGGTGEVLAKWEKSLTEELRKTWKTGVPTQMKSEGGATLKALDDRSVLASGKNPIADTYDLLLAKETQRAIAAMRLEALIDPSLTKGSASRGSNGNFVLSEFEVTYKLGGKVTRVKISRAEADYEQKGYGIDKAIDGVADASGWAVDGNTKRENRLAVFTFEKAIPAGAAVRVRMIHKYGGHHQIGRFRLAVAGAQTPVVSLAIQSILSTGPGKRNAVQNEQLRTFLTVRSGSPELVKAAAELASLRKEQASALTKFPATMVMVDKAGMRTTHILERGEYDKPGKEVKANVPAYFGSLPKGESANRLALAKWLTSPENPLTSRVTVNRYWQQFFGTGIVKSSEDFGRQSEWPSHPQLLDWLAVEFLESGWDVKGLLRQIVLSATYRQSSVVTPGMHARDPENRLLSRGPRMRLDGEVIRDSALFASGLLRPQIGGPSVYPYHPEGLWMELNNRPGYSRKYPHSKDPSNLYRRSMYTYWKRTVPPPSMATFDAPEREFCMVRRSRTNTPLQAFVLLHDPQFVEAARFLAERMLLEGGVSPEARLRFGFRTVTSRFPEAAELAVLKRALGKRMAHYKAEGEAAKSLLSVGALPGNKQLNAAEHAAYTAIARMLLNLSETITKG
ncbi:MAG: PSD1 and planctomycete cytochrome C domain-containing protein [Akkermansiaceae bacterium]